MDRLTLVFSRPIKDTLGQRAFLLLLSADNLVMSDALAQTLDQLQNRLSKAQAQLRRAKKTVSFHILFSIFLYPFSF